MQCIILYIQYIVPKKTFNKFRLDYRYSLRGFWKPFAVFSKFTPLAHKAQSRRPAEWPQSRQHCQATMEHLHVFYGTKSLFKYFTHKP